MSDKKKSWTVQDVRGRFKKVWTGRMTQVDMYGYHFDATLIHGLEDDTEECLYVAVVNRWGMDVGPEDESYMWIDYERIQGGKSVEACDKLFYGEITEAPRYETTKLTVRWKDVNYGESVMDVDMWDMNEDKQTTIGRW